MQRLDMRALELVTFALLDEYTENIVHREYRENREYREYRENRILLCKRQVCRSFHGVMNSNWYTDEIDVILWIGYGSTMLYIWTLMKYVLQEEYIINCFILEYSSVAISAIVVWNITFI